MASSRSGRARADRLDVGHARGGLDQDVDADAAGLPAVALLDLVEQRRHELDVGGRADLGHEHGVEHLAARLHHVDDVAVAPVGVEPVDAHADGRARPVVGAERLDDVARAPAPCRRAPRRPRGRGTRRRRRASAPSPSRARSCRARRARCGGGGRLRVIGTTSPWRAEQDRVERGEHPVGGLAVRVHAHQADAPDRRGLGAEPATDLDAVLAQDRASGSPCRRCPRAPSIGGELHELVVGVGEERVAARAHLRPGSSGRHPRCVPTGLEALLEGEPDALVQRVVLQDRHRVVVGHRPLDPVLLQQVDVEVERDGRLAVAASPPRARAADIVNGLEPGWAAQRLLRARVRVVDAPARSVRPARRRARSRSRRIRSASGAARPHRPPPSSATGNRTPVEVSACTTATSFVSGFARERLLDLIERHDLAERRGELDERRRRRAWPSRRAGPRRTRRGSRSPCRRVRRGS